MKTPQIGFLKPVVFSTDSSSPVDLEVRLGVDALNLIPWCQRQIANLSNKMVKFRPNEMEPT
jgi:hypothetical protein